MRLAIILLTYDGVVSWYCGVGSITQYFIHSMPEVISRSKPGVDISFFVGIPFTGKDCLGYREGLVDGVKVVVEKTGGRLLFFSDDSDGISQYGGPAQWEAASVGGASVVLNLLDRFDKIIIFAFDTPYCKVGELICNQLSDYPGENPVVIWVPHSTGLIHEIKTLPHSSERYAWELAAITASKKHESCYVGYINRFMKNHLMAHFKADEAKMLPLINGVVPVVAKSPNLPKWMPNKRVVFSCGRAEAYKGFEKLIKAFAKSQREHGTHLLINVSTSTSYAPVFEKLLKLMDELKVRGKIINEFLSMEDHLAAMTSRNVRAVVVPSLGEPFGLVPEEARLYGKQDCPVIIASDVDGLSEQICTGVDGFLVDVCNEDEFAKIITKVLSLDNEQRKRLAVNGLERLKQSYNYPENVVTCIASLPGLEEVFD